MLRLIENAAGEYLVYDEDHSEGDTVVVADRLIGKVLRRGEREYQIAIALLGLNGETRQFIAIEGPFLDSPSSAARFLAQVLTTTPPVSDRDSGIPSGAAIRQREIWRRVDGKFDK